MSKTCKIIFLPHANIRYSQLHPSKRSWVIKNSYEKLFDLILQNDYKIGFEASGETIDAIAELCPETLKKMNTLITEKKLEPVASPYTHIMLSNISPEVGLSSLKHGLDVWEKHTGVRPETGWNPECSWADYIPDIYKEAGFKNLITDADSFFLSFKEIKDAVGLDFDVQSHNNKNKLFRIEEYIKDKPQFIKYVTNPSVAPNGLFLIFRADMMCNPMLWYLMGATEGQREKPISIEDIEEMFVKWKSRVENTGSFIIPYAEDAEYIGSTAYFWVKQFGQARFFESAPESVNKFKQFLELAKRTGYELSTPSEVIKSSENIIKNDSINNVENGVAWHGGTAKAWLNTKHARILDPVCRAILDGIKSINNYLKKDFETMDSELKNALKKVTSAYISDARWPPHPTSPGRFNVKEAIDDLFKANEAIERSMKLNNIDSIKSLISPNLMRTQIQFIKDELMQMAYFEEA